METVKTQSTQGYKQRWAALFLLCAAQFMVIMDSSIIGVALPAIKNALGYDQSTLQWIFNAYVIFFGGFLLLGGKLSDIAGPRKIFIFGFAILTCASFLAGMAWSQESMNTGRALQGVGSALIAPAALTILMSMFTDPKELAKALGFWGASAAAGGSAGVFLVGVITQWLSWRWVLLINIPIGIGVLLMCKSLLPQGTAKKDKVDIISSLIITSGIVVAVYAIVSTDGSLINTRTLSLLFTAVLLIAIFIYMQKVKKDPLVPLAIFKTPNISAGNIVMGLMAGAWIPLWFFLNLYLQQILLFSPFQSGLALLPMTILIMILMVGMTGKLIARFGFKKNLLAGLFFLIVSLALFSTAKENGSYLVNLLVPSLLGAVGMSLCYIPGTIAAMSGVKPEETGLASGLVNTSYQIGSALGLAIIVAIATAKTNSLHGLGVTHTSALTGGFQLAFISAAVVCAFALVIASLFITVPSKES